MKENKASPANASLKLAPAYEKSPIFQSYKSYKSPNKLTSKPTLKQFVLLIFHQALSLIFHLIRQVKW